MSRYIVKGKNGDEEVIGEEFTIDGVEHKFIVHAAIGGYYKFSTTHLETGFKLSNGDTIDEAIANGIERWLSRSPDEHERAISKARADLVKRDARLAEDQKGGEK